MALANGQQTNGPPTSAKLSEEDEEDLRAINAAVDRMHAFTPPDPYILTIPQDVEPRYHHSYAFQARQWLENTPFTDREHESTQYQTFVFHEPGRAIYKLHNSRPLEATTNGDAMKDKAGTGANTPAGSQGPKKKISLDTYKKKQSAATPDDRATKEVETSAKKTMAKSTVDRLKADEEVLAAVEEDGDVAPHDGELPEGQKELKRKRSETLSETDVALAPEKQEVEDGEPDAKRQRRTPPREVDEQDEKPTGEQAPNAYTKPPVDSAIERQSLPPKLSPPPSRPEQSELPPKISPIDEEPSLPARLSPTLPPNIVATLNARAHYRSTSRSSDVSAPRSSSKDAVQRTLTPPPNKLEGGITKRKSPAPINGFRANSSSPAVRSDVEERGRPVTSMPPRPKTPELDSQDSEEIPVGKAARFKKQREPVADKPSRMFSYKFKNAGSRESFRRIVKFKPNPTKTAPDSDKHPEATKTSATATKSSDQRRRDRRDTNAKGVAQKIGPGSAMNGLPKKSDKPSPPEQKRPRADDTDDTEEPTMKRKRGESDSLDVKKPVPSTPPIQVDLKSPSSTQKPASQVTPSDMRKGLLTTSMKRDHSHDSLAGTPSAMSQASPPATGASQYQSQSTSGTAKAPSSQPSNKTPKQQAWESEQKRLETLGRSLKKEAEAHLKSLSMPLSDPATPSNEQKLAAVKSVESLLTYILAFTCSDEAASAADPRRTPNLRPWQSLMPFFRFVKKNCEPFPTLLGLACHLGVIFTARILDLISQHPAETPREMILECHAMMQRCGNDAEARLDLDTLQKSFPDSWKRRAKGTLAAETQLEVGKGFKPGPYKLPFGIHTTPMRAVRAGYAMLEEWVVAEGGKDWYTLHLKL